MNDRIPTILKWLIPIAVIIFLCMGAVVVFGGAAWLFQRSARVSNNPAVDLFNTPAPQPAAYQGWYGQDLNQPAADLIVMRDQNDENNRFAITGRLLESGANFISVAGLQLYTDETTSREGNLQNNSYVRVEGLVRPDSTLLAQRIMPAAGLETYPGNLRGVVESVDGGTLVISGVDIQTNDQTAIDRNIEPGSEVAVNGLVLQDGQWLALDVQKVGEQAGADLNQGNDNLLDNANENNSNLNGNENAGGGLVDLATGRDFAFTGRVESLNPWVVAGQMVEVVDKTELAKNIKAGHLVRVTGNIRQDGTWVASSIRRLDAGNKQATALLIGRVDNTDPWVINGLQLAVNDNSVIGEGLQKGDLVIAEVVVRNQNRWLARSIRPLAGQLRGDCFVVVDTIVRNANGEIVLRSWPGLIRQNDVNIEGELQQGSPVLATVCARGGDQFAITRLVLLNVGNRVQQWDGNDNEDLDNENDNGNENGNENDNGNDNENGGKVTICHYPPGNRGNAHTITIDRSALDAHLRNHGDTLGPCP